MPRRRFLLLFRTKPIGIGPECQSRARKVGNLAVRPPGVTEMPSQVMTRTVTPWDTGLKK
jgi:hypothetical protein